MTELIMLVLVLFINILAYWHRDRLLYMLGGFAFLLFGISYFTTSYYVGVLLVVAGLYNFAKAAYDRRRKA